MTIKFNEEYHRHIAHTHEDNKGKSICGEWLVGWHYLDVDHAFLSAPRDSIQPCPKCAAAVIKVFSEAE